MPGTDAVEHQLRIRQGKGFDVQPEEHEDGGQDACPPDGQAMAPRPAVGHEHHRQQEATEIHHKGDVRQEEPHPHHAEAAVHAMQVGLREQWEGHPERHGGRIGRDRGRIGGASADQYACQTIQECDGHQEAFAEQREFTIHGQYAVLCRYCSNADGAPSASVFVCGSGSSALKEYCMAPTANASATASSASVII